jgi:hypothetical protein
MPQSLRTGVPERFLRKQNRGGPVMSKYFLSAAVALMVGVAARPTPGQCIVKISALAWSTGF